MRDMLSRGPGPLAAARRGCRVTDLRALSTHTRVVLTSRQPRRPHVLVHIVSGMMAMQIAWTMLVDFLQNQAQITELVRFLPSPS